LHFANVLHSLVKLKAWLECGDAIATRKQLRNRHGPPHV
jgi:hypothetical protein